MRKRFKAFLTVDHVTTTMDVLGALSISAGIGLLAGFGAALIAAGVLTLAFSYLVA